MAGGPLDASSVMDIEKTGEEGFRILRRRMDSAGDGSGTKDMAGVADEYMIAPATTEDYILHSLRIIIEDTGLFAWDGFAAFGAALAQGILLKVKQLSGARMIDVVDLLDDDPITINSDLLHIGTVSLSSVPGRSVITCDVIFKELLGYRVRLNGKSKNFLSLETQDDMSALDRMQVWVHGLRGRSRDNIR